MMTEEERDALREACDRMLPGQLFERHIIAAVDAFDIAVGVLARVIAERLLPPVVEPVELPPPEADPLVALWNAEHERDTLLADCGCHAHDCDNRFEHHQLRCTSAGDGRQMHALGCVAFAEHELPDDCVVIAFFDTKGSAHE